jgi:hypothetical protein
MSGGKTVRCGGRLLQLPSHNSCTAQLLILGFRLSAGLWANSTTGVPQLNNRLARQANAHD